MNRLRFLLLPLAFCAMGAEGTCEVLSSLEVGVRVLDPANTNTLPTQLVVGENAIPVTCQTLSRGPYDPPIMSCYGVVEGVTPGFLKWSFRRATGEPIAVSDLSSVVRTCKAYEVDAFTFGITLREDLIPGVDPGTCTGVPIL